MMTQDHIIGILRQHLRVDATQEMSVVGNGYEVKVGMRISEVSIFEASESIMKLWRSIPGFVEED